MSTATSRLDNRIEKDKKMKPNLSRNWLIVYILAVTLIFYVLISLTIDPLTIYARDGESVQFEVKWQNIWLAIALGYLFASVAAGVLNPIQPDEMGVRIVLGIATDELSAGPPFAPPGLVEIETTKRTIDQREFPAEPSLIFRSKDEPGAPENPPEGSNMVHPLRVTFGEKPLTDEQARALFGDFYSVWPQGTTELTEGTKIPFDATVSDEDGLTKGRLTAEVAHVARLRVWKLKNLIEKIPADPVTGRRIDEVFRQIEDEQVAVINTILPKMTVGQALRNLPWINAVLFQKVCQRIVAEQREGTNGKVHSDGHSEEWGIDLEGTFIKTITFNRSVNQSIAQAVENVYEAQALANLAVGTREKTILEGQGAAQAARDLEQKTLEGRATGLEAIKKVAGSESGRAAIGSEVAREIAQGGNTILVGSTGITDILGVAAAAAQGMKGSKDK
jgi:regulator of protease activity HflC (stomatin/prohibitin superfamily)